MFVSCCDCIIAGQYAISEEELWRLDENALSNKIISVAALFLRLMVCPVPQYVTPMSLLISLLMGLLMGLKTQAFI